MKNTRIMPWCMRIFKATLFGIAMLVFGGTVMAATVPAVTGLQFRDDKGTPDPSDDVLFSLETRLMPTRIAADDKGNVYITDPYDNKISIFNTNGRLIRQFALNRALGVSVDSLNKVVFASGYLKGKVSIHILDNNNDDKDDSGDLGSGWDQPSDIELDSKGNVYVIDDKIVMVGADGTVRNYGPYHERYASETIDGTVYNMTRHKMVFPQGLAVDESNGLMYVTIREMVEYLSNGCSGSGDYINCYADTEESWKYYHDVLNTTADSTYKYWNAATGSSASKYHILVINSITGDLIKKITTGEGDFAFKPEGLALDGKGRLYAAGMGGSYATTGGGEIKVYDLDTGLELSVPGFSLGFYKEVAFSPDTDPVKGGRLFATMHDSKTIVMYGIDGGTNPLNNPPGAPTLVSPAAGSGDPVTVLPLTLTIGNAADYEDDPLTYGYEIRKDGTDSVITRVFGISAGGGGTTSIPVDYSFEENMLYRWRGQSFDGSAASEWSGEAVFCVNTRNDNPTTPSVIAPVNGLQSSPFSSYLTWTASSDPDCNDAIKNYAVDVAADASFATVLSSATVSGTTVRLGDVISGLPNGGSYFWRVKAVDNNNGASDYATGSFTYKTTVVSFSSDQPDTKVYIDGNYGYRGRLLGTANLEVQNITPGSHFVAFEKAGYEPYYTVVEVTDSGDVITVPQAAMIAASKIRPSAAGTELARIDNGSSSPFIVDYNNDGLKDMVAGGRNGMVYLYLSEKQIIDGVEKVVLSVSGVLQADGTDINVGSRAVPFVADYNNDGRKDLLVGSGEGYINLYMNTGTETAPIFKSSGTVKDGNGNDIKVGANSAPAITDYNNDGKKDLVVGGDDGTLRLYINIGTDDSAPVFDASYVTVTADGLAINAASNSKPFFTDWNSDGTTDLLVGGGSSLRIYLNNGTNDSPDFVYSSDIRDLTGGAGDASPFVVDWDGTTARDIVVGNGLGGIVSYISACGGNVSGNNPPSAPVLREPANGSYVGSATPVLQIDNASDPEGCPLTYGYEIADVNSIVVASDSGMAEGSDGRTSIAVSSQLSENAVYALRVQAFDGDTATGTTWSAPVMFWVNAYNDNPTSPAVIGPVNDAVASSFSTMLSWRQSTDPDLNDTVSYYLEVAGEASFGSGTVAMSLSDTSVRLDQIATSMVNNSKYHWRVKAVDNNGGQSEYSEGSFVYRTTVATFASDQAGTKVYIDGNYGYLGRLFGTAPAEVQNLSPGSHFVTFVKAGYEPYYTVINVIDPVLGGSAISVTAAMTDAVKISHNKSGSTLIKIDSGPSSPFVVDYNNDGHRDMIVGGGDGKISLLISEAQLQADGTTNFVLVEKGVVQADGVDIIAGSRAVPFVVDYNNDGRKDLLAGSDSGRIYLYLNAGTEDAPIFTSFGTIKDSNLDDIKVASNSAPSMVDYNNDGRKDLFVGSSDGLIRLYLNIGTDESPLFGSTALAIAATDANGITREISAGSDSKVFFVDWNADGKKDLLVGRGASDSEGNTVNLYFNVGLDEKPEFVSVAGLHNWIKDRKKERGNREYMPYLGYNLDMGDRGGNATPFIVDWDGSQGRDVIVGNGNGEVVTYLSE